MRKHGTYVGQRGGVTAPALQLLHRRRGDVQKPQAPQAELRARDHQIHRRVFREPVTDQVGHRMQRRTGGLARQGRAQAGDLLRRNPA